MAAERLAARLVLIILCAYSIYGSESFSSNINVYSSGTLACKTYNTSKMDCSHRSLKDIPILDRNWTIVLDLSHNQLKEMHGEPFCNLSMLTYLDLSRNEISTLMSTVFRGLHSLLKLYLNDNKITALSSDIFSDLLNLASLNIGGCPILLIPSQTLATLHSLQYLTMTYKGSTLDTTMSNFDNLTKLKEFKIDFDTNITNTTFLPLADLPIHTFSLLSLGDDFVIDKTAFVPFTNARDIRTNFRALPALRNLSAPLQALWLLTSFTSFPYILHNRTFEVLSKFHKSLTILALYLPSLRHVENDSFMWLHNLGSLILHGQIETISKQSFRGLSSLHNIYLGNNRLTALPSNALNNIGKSASLQHLDLSSNSISTISDDVFVALSSITYLNLENNKMQDLIHIFTKWLNVLQNLKHLVFGSTSRQYGPIVTIGLSTPLLSLEVLEIKTVRQVKFTSNLCSSFPKVNYVDITDADVINFTYSMALHECLFLKTLDLSGSICNIDLVHLNISIPSLKDLTLARNKLTSIEQVLFIKAPNLAVLNLTDNKIQFLDSVIAHAFKRLIDLSIDGNGVVSLAGIKDLIYLKHLNAARNQITEVPLWLTSKINAPVLMTLDLSANPFSCTCEIEHFRKWIASDTSTWLEPGLYNCATPKTLEGVSVSAIELDCRSFTAFYLGVSIPSAIIFCMIIICFIRYQWHIKYKLFLIYRNYRPFPDNNDNFEMLQLQYHAYIAYNENSEDDAWVMNDLQPNMEEGPEPVKLCIKNRDFIPGHSLIESISENIHQSHKTIIVLSPNFVESNWCHHEMEMAKMRLLDENLDVIILVLLSEIPNNKMTLSLRHLLCKKEYLKWPNDRAGQRLFWQRLRHEIKEPVQVDHHFCM